MKKKITRYLNKSLFLIVILLLLAMNLSAQITSRGKDFWLGYMENLTSGGGGTLQLDIFITSDEGATGTVSIPNAGWSAPFTVTANSSTTVQVPIASAHITTSEKIENKAVHVVSDNNINVFAMNYFPQTSDGTLILPKSALGNNYRILNYVPLSLSEFLIVAAYDNTTIRYIPTQNTSGGVTAGSAKDITLNAGEAFQVQATADLTGTIVFSTGTKLPFAVFGGDQCAQVPHGTGYCNNLFEQMYPITTWRRNFVTIPLMTRTKGEIYRILALKNSTNVKLDNNLIATLNAGEFKEIVITTPSFISANLPISVAQYSPGHEFDGNANSDPFYIMLSPVEQTREDITFEVFQFSTITGNYVNVSAVTSCTDHIYLDGTLVTGWQPVASNPTYSTTQLTVSQGAHRLNSNPPDCGFNAYVYGYGPDDSYGYSAGVSLDTLSVALLVNTNCAGQEVGFFVQSQPYTILNYNWDFGDQGTSTDMNPKHVYLTGGNYNVRLIVTYDDNSVDTVTKQILVFDQPHPIITPLGPTTFCSCDDSLTMDAGNLGYKEYKWSNGATTQKITIHQSGNYTVFVKDSNGCTNTSPPLVITIIQPETTVGFGMPSYSVNSGDSVAIPLVILKSANLDTCHSKNYSVKISFDKSLLSPIGSTPKGDKSTPMRIIPLTGIRTPDDSILTVLNFEATLGDSEQTTLSIDNFVWNDCVFATSSQSSVFKIADLCKAGGVTRLIKQAPKLDILDIKPNPAGTNAKITFILGEKSNYSIYLSDILGQKLLTIEEGNHKPGTYETEIDLSQILSGTYIITIKTETENVSKLIEVNK
ncbi:MAG: PKD domain-containing protein [FCB group bacterium]|jgi:hypothetical protein